MPHIHFSLKWDTFVRHCFRYGVLGHVIVECPRKRNNAMEVIHEDPIDHYLIQTFNNFRANKGIIDCK